MNRLLAILLLCPLAAAAAEWSYDGGMAGTGSQGGEMTMTEADSASGSMDASSGMAPSAGPAPAGAPTNNMTMDAVRTSQGDPENILAAVGEPPITRWQYPEYVVYFEHERVIISVAGRW